AGRRDGRMAGRDEGRIPPWSLLHSASETGRQKRLRGKRRRAGLHASCAKPGAASGLYGAGARAALASIARLNEGVSGIGRKEGSEWERRGPGAPGRCGSAIL